MSDQELVSMMAVNDVAAPVSAASVDAPAAAATDVNPNTAKVEAPHVTVGECTDVFAFVTANSALTTGWTQAALSVNGTAVTDTKKVLVGINSDGVPVTFDYNNLYIPTALLTGVTSIKVLISGIIIMQPNADIYVTKNNVYVYQKDTTSHARVKLVKYLKAKKDCVQYIETNRDTTQTVDAEYTKFVIKATGGRLFTIIEDLTDLAAMKEAVLKFLAEKVTDINYCIKIEDICLQLGF